MIKAVIFDLDDTLVNTWPSHRAGIDAALERFGHRLSELPVEDLSRLVGRRTKDSFAWLIEYFKLPASVDELAEIRRPVFEKARVDSQMLFPGVEEVLRNLRVAELRLTLVSSGREHYVTSVLERWRIKEYFDDVLGGDEVTKGKPDPEPYRRAVEILTFSPEGCVVIEDAAAGIESARAAGCWSIGVENPNTPPQNVGQADRRIRSITELTPSLIQSIA